MSYIYLVNSDKKSSEKCNQPLARGSRASGWFMDEAILKMAYFSLNQLETDVRFDFRSIYEVQNEPTFDNNDSSFTNNLNACDDYGPEKFN